MLGAAVTIAPVRTDVDPAVLTPDLRKALALVHEADEAVPTLWTILPGNLWYQINTAYHRFLDPAHEIDAFMQSLEEVRQDALAQGLLPD